MQAFVPPVTFDLVEQGKRVGQVAINLEALLTAEPAAEIHNPDFAEIDPTAIPTGATPPKMLPTLILRFKYGLPNRQVIGNLAGYIQTMQRAFMATCRAPHIAAHEVRQMAQAGGGSILTPDQLRANGHL